MDVCRAGYVGWQDMIEGSSGRRHRPDEDKTWIVAESLMAGLRVADVARCHGPTRWQVYGWRHRVRAGRLALPERNASSPAFPALVVDEKPQRPASAGVIEILVDDVVIRAAPGVDARHLSRVIALCGRRHDCAEVIAAVYVAPRPVDFRKGHDGLAAAVKEMFGFDPISGAVFVFRLKRAVRVKVPVFSPSKMRAPAATVFASIPARRLAILSFSHRSAACSSIPHDNDRDVEDAFIRDAAVSYWHQCGTAKKGRDVMSVVDSSLYNVERLRVAHAPRSGRGSRPASHKYPAPMSANRRPIGSARRTV